LRFAVNTLRADPVVLGTWIKTGHTLSLVLVVVAGWALWTRHRADVAKLFKRAQKRKKQ